MQRHLAPLSGFVNEQYEVANLVDLQRCAGNAGLGQQVMRVKQAGKVEASTGGVKAARFVGKLLLPVDPVTIQRRLKLRHARFAQRRAYVEAQNVTKVIEFKDAG